MVRLGWDGKPMEKESLYSILQKVTVELVKSHFVAIDHPDLTGSQIDWLTST